MRRILSTALGTALVLVMAAAPAGAATQKYSFSDVELPNGAIGEIEASTKDKKNKADSVYCGYFSDDYMASLGYYFEHVEAAPTERSEVLNFCLDNFGDRFS